MLFNKIESPIIISVGGSLVVPKTGIDINFLKKFNTFIRLGIKNGKRFFLVVGGGSIMRQYRDAASSVIKNVSDEDLDWLAIHNTRLNAQLVRTIFQDIAHPRIIENYDRKLRNWKEPVVIGAGWKPGWSTDYDAVILARDYGAKLIINLSNIDWVYDKDPNIFKEAKPIKKITWGEMETLVGNKWTPGLNTPFDPIATRLAKTMGLTVIVTNGRDFKNLENIMNGDDFKGTVIMPFRIDAEFYDREYYSGKKGEYRVGYIESFIGRFFHSIVSYYRAWLIKLFLNPKNCLDVGCGTGRLVKSLRSLGIDAYGVEISQTALEVAEPSIKPYLKEADVIKLPYKDDQFDLVLTFDVMEHLEKSKIKKAVAETVRVSKKHVLHKIYTIENEWINLWHSHDFSHISVLSKKYWQELFNAIENISVLRGSFFKLPVFFETIFLLRKK